MTALGVIGVAVVAHWSTSDRPLNEDSTANSTVNPLAVVAPLPPSVESTPSVESINGEGEQRLATATQRAPELPLVTSLDPPAVSDALPSEEPPTSESWTRCDADGDVSIEAVVLARFVAGSKLAVIHLPFMPPLPEVPQIECEPLDSGCEVSISVDAAYRHGAKLSVTRRSASLAESVPIGVVIYTRAAEEIES